LQDTFRNYDAVICEQRKVVDAQEALHAEPFESGKVSIGIVLLKAFGSGDLEVGELAAGWLQTGKSIRKPRGDYEDREGFENLIAQPDLIELVVKMVNDRWMNGCVKDAALPKLARYLGFEKVERHLCGFYRL
jgi:hypothetical protein